MIKAITITLVLFTMAISGYTLAQVSGGDFQITKSTIDGGGATSSGGDFSVTGTIGQNDGSLRTSTGGNFLLDSGFWAKSIDRIFKDGFENG